MEQEEKKDKNNQSHNNHVIIITIATYLHQRYVAIVAYLR